jgi:hypothetical protein
VKTLRSIYRRVDEFLRRRWVKLVLTALVLIVVSGLGFGSLIGTTYSLDAQRRTIVQAISGQNVQSGDEHAVTLYESGTITIDGQTYGGEWFAQRPELVFDENGTISVPGALADALLRDQRPSWAPRWLVEQPGTTWMLAVVFTAWWLLIIWMDLVPPYVLTAAGTGLAVGGAALAGSAQAMWAFAGMGLLTFTFVLLIRAILIVLQRPNQICAVAHTVVKEASRTKIALVFIVVILIMLPLLPLGLDSSSPLRYQLQTYISRSLGFTFYLAACMTLVLSCASVAFEIRDRQIWQLVTKPVSRLNYLLGKWVGVISVNLIIMLIASVSIFTFIQYLRDQPVADGMAGYQDAQQVKDAVLTARVGRKPEYQTLDGEQLRARVDELIASRAELMTLEDVPLSTRRALAVEVIENFATGQRSIPPGAVREYRFEGLQAARNRPESLTLRYRFHIMRDDEHETFPAVFFFNGDPELQVTRRYVPTVTHVLSVPSELIQEDGSLIIAVANLYEPPNLRRGAGALNFEFKDFELLYKVGSFEANFARAIIVDWVKLSFLAMLGICCATFLSFPVACLMSFTIFIAGTIGPFLARSLDEYYPPSIEAVDWSNVGMVIRWAFKSAIRGIAQTIVFLLESFGQYRPTQALVEGRLIAWNAVVAGALKVGVLWSGLALVIGYFTMRSRQLAIYSGHG